MYCRNLPDLSYYFFNCPNCHDEVRHTADERVIKLFSLANVCRRVWAVPAEVLEPKVGAPLSYDDLLDFGLALSEPFFDPISKELTPSEAHK